MAVGRPPDVEHAVDSQRDQRVEGFQEIAGLVKCLVKRDAEWPGQRDQPRGLVAVDRGLVGQNTQDDSRGPERLGDLDVVPDDRQLALRMDEVTRAGRIRT